jgi:hypothetical protein
LLVGAVEGSETDVDASGVSDGGAVPETGTELTGVVGSGTDVLDDDVLDGDVLEGDVLDVGAAKLVPGIGSEVLVVGSDRSSHTGDRTIRETK